VKPPTQSASLVVPLIALLALTAAPARSADWTVVPEASRVTMIADKQGTKFQGTFGEFSAAIDFDPAVPETGSIVGIVQTPSFATEDSQNHTYVIGYLEVEEYPEARFVSRAIEKTADGYRALGDLTLKGVTNPATLDFTFEAADAATAAGAMARFQAQMTVNRFDYDIAGDIDTNWAGRDVVVQVVLELKP